MCASSCARIASSCCGVSAASALAGSRTTGFSHPMTVGTSTSVDSSSVIARRDVQAARQPRAPSAATRPPRARAVRRSRCTQSQPVSSRRLSIATPASQTRISVGSSGSSGSTQHARQRSRHAITRCRRRRRAAGIAAQRSPRVDRRSRTPASRRRQRGGLASTASARSDWNFCTPLTTGSVSISASADGRDDVADVGGAAAQRASSASAVSTPTTAPCQTNCRSAQPDGLGGRLLQQGLNRGHLGPPSRFARRRSPSGCPAAPRRTRAWWRAPA